MIKLLLVLNFNRTITRSEVRILPIATIYSIYFDCSLGLNCVVLLIGAEETIIFAVVHRGLVCARSVTIIII